MVNHMTAQGQLCRCTQPQFLCPNRSPSRFSISSRASCRRPHYFYRFSPYSRLRPRDLAQIARGDLSAATSSFFATFFRSGSGTVHRLLIKRRISLSTQYFTGFSRIPYLSSQRCDTILRVSGASFRQPFSYETSWNRAPGQSSREEVFSK